MNRYFGRIVTRSESHSRQANSSTLFAAVSPGGGRSDVFDMEVFLASPRLSARSARHRCWSALERFDLRAFASVPAMPSKKNGISPEIGDEENRATIVAAPPNLSFAAFNDDVDHAPCDRHRSELRHDPARMVACRRSGWARGLRDPAVVSRLVDGAPIYCLAGASRCFFTCNGIRHLWWDTGRGTDLRSVDMR